MSSGTPLSEVAKRKKNGIGIDNNTYDKEKNDDSFQSSITGISGIFDSTAGGMENVPDGCIILGKRGLSGNRYITRYKIDRHEQNEEVSREVLMDTFCPMIPAVARGASCGKVAWLFFSSEPFLMFLHISVLILGVLKECLNLRTVDEDLHFIHSVVETFIACMLVAIQAVSAWTSLNALKEFRQTTEHVTPEQKGVIYRHQKRSVGIATFFDVFFILFMIGAFILFMNFAHLGWTLLSNNFALLVTGIVNGITLEKLHLSKASGIKDQHKAVIYETLLLFAEMAWAKTPKDIKAIHDKVERFGKALQETDTFVKPGHIYCDADQVPRMNILATMQLQSMV